MNVVAKFDEIPSIILQDIKETKCYGHTFVRSFGQCENSIPSHKHSLHGYKKYYNLCSDTLTRHYNRRTAKNCNTWLSKYKFAPFLIESYVLGAHTNV